MQIICDTHVMLYWADAPEKLSELAEKEISQAINAESLACSDISLWEIAMLCKLGRLNPLTGCQQYIEDIITAMKLSVLPITADIAVMSQSEIFLHKDPADRLICATALSGNFPLITRDQKLQAVKQIKTIW